MSAPAAEFFQALSDETRLRLLERLRAGERTVGDLVDELGCPQPKVSRHLKVLREVGLVRDQRDGRHVTYTLTTRKSWPAEAVAWLDRLDAGFVAPEFDDGGAPLAPADAASTDVASADTGPADPGRSGPPASRRASSEPAPHRSPAAIETHLL